MKKIALALAALLAFTVSAFAQKSPTPVVVNMAELFNGYYKTADAQLRIDSAQQTLNKDFETQANELKALEAKIKEKLDGANSAGLTEEGKQKIFNDTLPMRQELETKFKEYQTKRQQAAQELQQTAANTRATLMKEITEKAIAVAKQKNADMVLSLNTGVIWADSAYDITKEVLEALNAGQTKK